jgi:membrane associated rhomboid family serine protease
MQRAGSLWRERSIHRAGSWYNRRVLVGLVAAIAIGAVVGVVTLVDGRLRIADEAPLTLLVCVSGAVAGWALMRTLGLASDEGVGIADVLGPIVGALLIAYEAWKGRRRTFSELGLHTHSE